MLPKDFKKWKPILDYTGGSTGKPLKYYITKDVASVNWAGMFRGWSWSGYRIGDRRIKFGGSSLIPNKAPSLFQITRDKLERNFQYSALSINESKYDKLVHIIRKYKPKFLYGLASATYLFSDYCKCNNIKNIKFDAVFSTAEVLLPHYRTAIENQFQCKVFDQYGSYDGGGQALECQTHQGFHISIEKVILEILDENEQRLSPGKSGYIVVTDLYDYAMPFIRYEVEDMGMLSDKLCTCGRNLPLLKAVEGRTTDIIKLSNGVILSGLTIPVIFAKRPVKQYQLIQESKDKLLVKIVKDVNYSESDTDYVLKLLRHHAGEGIQIDVKFYDKIPVEGNSKFRYVISKI
jgi:phenylacetate-CoA ligase